MLEIKNLHVSIEEKEILKGVNLKIQAGEVHAIMGPNGSGKSTLSKVLAGHPSYKITSGSVEFEINGKKRNLLEFTPDERAKEGVFLAYQYPIEIPGVNNFSFLHLALNAVLEHQGSAILSEDDFKKLVEKKLPLVGLTTEFLDRPVNVGFSGGEKKRNEILQMILLSPRLAILDETDSGLDIDALRTIAAGVNQFRKPHNAQLLITHYQRLLELIKPDFVHILADGKIIETGGPELALRLEKTGYVGLIP